MVTCVLFDLKMNKMVKSSAAIDANIMGNVLWNHLSKHSFLRPEQTHAALKRATLKKINFIFMDMNGTF